MDTEQGLPNSPRARQDQMRDPRQLPKSSHRRNSKRPARLREQGYEGSAKLGDRLSTNRFSGGICHVTVLTFSVLITLCNC